MMFLVGPGWVGDYSNHEESCDEEMDEAEDR